MKLIKRLGRRLCSTGKNYAYYNLYLCPYCKKEVEKQTGYEKRYKSCGCMHNYFSGLTGLKHGDGRVGKRTKLNNSWNNMIQRCTNENRPEYKNYGGRGIKLYEEWKDYIKFKAWAVKTGYKEGLVIDRIDNNGNYEPNNCRWVTRTESCRNQRNTQMTWEKVRDIRKKYATGNYTQTRLWKEYNVTSGTMSNIIHNKSWTE